MGLIVCSTRGGEESRRTQERAIALAQEQGDDLVFLYVVDSGFAGTVDEAMRATLTDELRRLGKCLLRLAQTRALEQGLKARAVIREGKVPECIEMFVREVGASTLVIGSPQRGAGRHMFEREGLSHFSDALQQSTGIEVVVAE